MTGWQEAIRRQAAEAVTRRYTRRRTGWLSADRLVFLERGAPMQGGQTDAWMIWLRAEDGEVLPPAPGEFFPTLTRGALVDPIRTLAELTYTLADGEDWYVHRYDAGSLAEAKMSAEQVLAERA